MRTWARRIPTSRLGRTTDLKTWNSVSRISTANRSIKSIVHGLEAIEDYFCRLPAQPEPGARRPGTSASFCFTQCAGRFLFFFGFATGSTNTDFRLRISCLRTSSAAMTALISALGLRGCFLTCANLLSKPCAPAPPPLRADPAFRTNHPIE
jgi:hypothetical protein